MTPPSAANLATRGAIDVRPGTWDWGSPQLNMPNPPPRMRDVAQQALLSDVVSSPNYVYGVYGGHITGVNVFSGDGSAKYVLVQRF